MPLQAFVDKHILANDGGPVLCTALVHGNVSEEDGVSFGEAGARCFGVMDDDGDAPPAAAATACSAGADRPIVDGSLETEAQGQWRPQERIVRIGCAGRGRGRGGSLLLHAAASVNPDELNSATEFYFQCEADTEAAAGGAPALLPRRCCEMDLLGRYRTQASHGQALRSRGSWIP
jgi:hypothetical protein